ncbi:unnamed protein product [Prorocentrum cordatum]|uniref:Uncharacterized protein n=1 Tax=Prorocentrum cordatum TaxID=2364126 RepID=A0ABN9WRF9_9DINO|nr:unnamed protein product [Polarella glacialis]
MQDLPAGTNTEQYSFPGHVFTVREAESGMLVKLYRVEADATSSSPEVTIAVCAASSGSQRRVDQSRWEEFEQLAQDHHSPCIGHSTEWSCVLPVSERELEQRPHKLYGFQEGETGSGNPYKVGATVDHVWMDQQKYIVNVSSYEGGFLKMRMTDHMKSLLYPWFDDRLQACENGTMPCKHAPIPGFFTNSHVVGMDKIELTSFRNIHQGIVSEMQQVLEWWTKQPLEHTTTFGLRIYRRGSMLINHLDRKDTHVASAVLQVGARADVGWPLEVIHPHKPGLMEVYLQPGEMVLYEGARVVHGRPMRFQGEMFGNIFSHFKPLGWKGPSGWVNPHYKRGLEKLQKQSLEL